MSLFICKHRSTRCANAEQTIVLGTYAGANCELGTMRRDVLMGGGQSQELYNVLPQKYPEQPKVLAKSSSDSSISQSQRRHPDR